MFRANPAPPGRHYRLLAQRGHAAAEARVRGEQPVGEREPGVALAPLHQLHAQPVAVLADHSGARVCRHFFHFRCARELLDWHGREQQAASRRGPGPRAAQCPLCRAEYLHR